MPEGPLGAPRLTNVGPLSRITKSEMRSNWEECPSSGKDGEICKMIKRIAIQILEDQEAFPEYETLQDINSGNCHKLAQVLVNTEVGDGVDVLKAGYGYHVWVEYKGTHFDAETPSGVDDYKQLPFFDRVSEDVILKDIRRNVPKEDEPETLDETIENVTKLYKVGKTVEVDEML
jgi:hypothetical protein